MILRITAILFTVAFFHIWYYQPYQTKRKCHPFGCDLQYEILSIEPEQVFYDGSQLPNLSMHFQNASFPQPALLASRAGPTIHFSSDIEGRLELPVVTNGVTIETARTIVWGDFEK